MTCQYLVTKRPGRKRDSSVNIRPESTEGQNSRPSTSDLCQSPSRPESVSGVECISTTDMYPGAWSPSSFDGTTNLDNFYSSSMQELFQLHELDTINFTQEYNDIEKLLIPDHIYPDLASDSSSFDPLASKASSPSLQGQSLSNSTSYASVADVISSDLDDKSTCSCLMSAVDLLKNLSSKNNATCATFDSHDNAKAISASSQSYNPSAQVIVMENRQTIEAVSNMLQCSCSQDAYLLTILSMIVFKVLGRYTAAARKQPTREPIEGYDSPEMKISSSSLSSYSYGDENRGRIDAQLILSELHCVQRLVNRLSLRRKGREIAGESEGGRVVGEKDAGGDSKITSKSDDCEMATATFSATTLDLIEIDLRKCLRNLSSEIINILRQI
jgi:hypothetical protein